MVYHSRFGLRLRACGENPHAADAAGVSVERQRYMAMLIAGILCSFSGAYLSIVQSGFFLRDMSAGAGYLALTAMVFGNWRPLYTFLGCLMFGFFGAVQIQIEGVELPVVGRLPGALIQMVPYVLTVIVLAGLMAKSVAPKAWVPVRQVALSALLQRLQIGQQVGDLLFILDSPEPHRRPRHHIMRRAQVSGERFLIPGQS
jgi:simple sugar transport system permease protein